MLDIKDHITSHASPTQTDEGLYLWSNDSLISPKDDLKIHTRLFYCNVAGRKCMVMVNFDKNKIESKCECIHPMFSLCEHQVAAILMIAEEMDIKVFSEFTKGEFNLGDYLFMHENVVQIAPKAIVKAKRKDASEPFEISPSDNLEMFINPHRGRRYGYSYGAEVKEEQNHLVGGIFRFEVRENSYWSFYNVQLFQLTDKWYTTCNCHGKTSRLCAHEEILFEKIVHSWHAANMLSVNTARASIREAVMKEFNIKDVDIERYFTLAFTKGRYYYKAREQGLMGKAQSNNAIQRLLNIRDPIRRLHTDVPHAGSEATSPVYALLIFPKRIAFAVISGNESKKGGSLTHIQTQYHLDLPEDWLPAKEWLRTMAMVDMDMSIAHVYGYMEKMDMAAGFAAMAKARAFLQEVPVYVNKKPNRVSRNTISPVSVKNVLADIEIVIDESEVYFYAKPVVIFGSHRVNLSDERDIVLLPFMSLYKGEVYFHPTLEFGELLAYFINLGSITYLKQKQQEFFSFVEKLSQSVRIKFDINIKQKEVQLSGTGARLYLHEENGHIVFVPKIAYDDGLEIPLLQPNDHLKVTPSLVRRYVRDKEFETAFMQKVCDLIPEFVSMCHQGIFYLRVEQVTDKNWFFRLIEWAASNEVEIFGTNDLPSLKYSTKFPSLNLQLTSGIDWFNSTIDIDFDGEKIPLSQLRRVINQKDEFVQLKDGSLGIIPDEWRKKLEVIFRIGTVSGDSVRMPKLQFLIIEELFDNIDDEAIQAEITAKKQRLASFESIAKAQLPIAITADLRPYQKEGFHWLCFLQEYGFGGCLADDMGLGKTLQVLCVLARAVESGASTSLIVVPRSLLFNWENEILKFCPTLNYVLHHGGQRWQNGFRIEDNNIVISTYGTLMRDVEALSKITFEYVVLDESQAIKNPGSKTYKAVRLLQARQRLVMTGTPIENNTFDLYAQLTFANPGLFGTQKAFLDNYVKPIDMHQDNDRALELRRIIHPFVLRRTKEQVAPDLPSRTEQVLYCELPTDQRKVYELYRKKYAKELDEIIEANGLNKSKIWVLEGLTRLRQICNAPALVSNEFARISSEKLDVLTEQLVSIVTHHKALVFSQFVQMLKLIVERLDASGIKYYYLDGQTTDRKSIVEEFQNTPDNCVFLISLKAGGTGLNLTSAEYVFIVDPWWNPAAEQQAIDRTHRIGQEKPVMAYKLICKNSIEEKIMLLQSKKRQIAADLIRTEDGMFKSLTREDVVELFAS